MSFVVYSLPRSRSYWLSKFLSYREWVCGHDQLRYCRSMDDIKSWLTMPCTGSCETGGAWYWRLVPTLKTVVIRRPVADVIASLVNTGLPWDIDVLTKQMTALDRKLDQIVKRVPNVLAVNYDDLDDACQRIFEHCLPYPHDAAWYAGLAKLNLQVNLAHEMLYFKAHEAQILKLAKIARHHILMGLQVGREADFDDGVSIHQEPFSKAWPDAKRAMRDHCAMVGESPDFYETINHGLMRKLDDLGGLQVMVGRSNGRLCGYLISVISPSFESERKVGTHTAFFADPAFHGVGLKLQRAANDAMRQKGVHEVHMRSGGRGGERLSVLYRRLGAVPHGNLYKLDLQP